MGGGGWQQRCDGAVRLRRQRRERRGVGVRVDLGGASRVRIDAHASTPPRTAPEARRFRTAVAAAQFDKMSILIPIKNSDQAIELTASDLPDDA